MQMELEAFPKGSSCKLRDPGKRLVAYLSKRLDPVAGGWPTCLRAIVAITLLIKAVDKLTLGQDLFLRAPYSIEALLRGAPKR